MSCWAFQVMEVLANEDADWRARLAQNVDSMTALYTSVYLTKYQDERYGAILPTDVAFKFAYARRLCVLTSKLYVHIVDGTDVYSFLRWLVRVTSNRRVRFSPTYEVSNLIIQIMGAESYYRLMDDPHLLDDEFVRAFRLEGVSALRGLARPTQVPRSSAVQFAHQDGDGAILKRVAKFLV